MSAANCFRFRQAPGFRVKRGSPVACDLKFRPCRQRNLPPAQSSSAASRELNDDSTVDAESPVNQTEIPLFSRVFHPPPSPPLGALDGDFFFPRRDSRTSGNPRMVNHLIGTRRLIGHSDPFDARF